MDGRVRDLEDVSTSCERRLITRLSWLGDDIRLFDREISYTAVKDPKLISSADFVHKPSRM